MMLNNLKHIIYLIDCQSVEIYYVFLIFPEYLILLFFKLYLIIFAKKIETQCPKTFNRK